MIQNLFNTLSSSAITLKNLSKGELVFRQGDMTFAMFYLKHGQVQLVRHNQNGDKLIIHHAHKGETFAEAALFSSEYHCDAIVGEDAEFERLDKGYILAEMKRNPEFAIALSAQFARQIQSYRRHLEIHSIRNANERVFIAISEGLMTGNIKAFASKIGLTHETVYRELANLTRQAKLVKTARGQYSLVKKQSHN